MKILLIQIRKDVIKEHEYRCLLEKSGLLPNELVSFDIFEKLITPADLDGYDALMIGGSGGYCVSERTIPTELDAISHVICTARERKMPILGLCFGHQLLAEALGGIVKMDRNRQELGTCKITRLPASDIDPIFSQLPQMFLAQEGHKDHVISLPPGAVHLAAGELSPLQAFTFTGEGIYGLQFHPELSRNDVLTRLEHYKELYLKSMATEETTDAGADGKTEFDEVIARTFETPEAEQILKLFIEKIVRGRERYPILTDLPLVVKI